MDIGSDTPTWKINASVCRLLFLTVDCTCMWRQMAQADSLCLLINVYYPYFFLFSEIFSGVSRGPICSSCTRARSPVWPPLCRWHLCRAFNCRILYGLYLPTVILTVIWHSITHSLFLSRLKTSLLCKSFPLQPFLSSTEIFITWIPRTVYRYFWAYMFSTFSFFLFLHFLVVGSVQ